MSAQHGVRHVFQRPVIRDIEVCDSRRTVAQQHIVEQLNGLAGGLEPAIVEADAVYGAVRTGKQQEPREVLRIEGVLQDGPHPAGRAVEDHQVPRSVPEPDNRQHPPATRKREGARERHLVVGAVRRD